MGGKSRVLGRIHYAATMATLITLVRWILCFFLFFVDSVFFGLLQFPYNSVSCVFPHNHHININCKGVQVEEIYNLLLHSK